MVKTNNATIKPAQQSNLKRRILTPDTKAQSPSAKEVKTFPNKETDKKARELQSKIEQTAPTPQQVLKKGQENVKDLVKTEKRKDGKMTRSRESYVFDYLKSRDSRIFKRAQKELEKLGVSDKKKADKYEISFKQFFADWNDKQTNEEIHEEFYVLGCVEFASFLSALMYGIELDKETKLRIVDEVLTNTIVNNGQDKYSVFADVANNMVDNEIDAILEEQL